MSDLQPYTVLHQPLERDARRAGRAISRYQADSRVTIAVIDVLTDETIAKTDSTTAVTGQAMANVVRVAQAQQSLEQLAPAASGRLAMLADDHALGMAELAADYRRKLRRV